MDRTEKHLGVVFNVPHQAKNHGVKRAVFVSGSSGVGDPFPCLFQLLGANCHSLARGPFLKLKASKGWLENPPVCLFCSHVEGPMPLPWASPDNPGPSPHLKFSWLATLIAPVTLS